MRKIIDRKQAFSHLTPWYRELMLKDAIKKARETCVCAFSPKPSGDEEICRTCHSVAVVLSRKFRLTVLTVSMEQGG